MNRHARQIAVLTRFLLRDLARSLAGAVPPSLTLSFYAFTFTYPATVDYFAGVGGASLVAVAIVSTLVMAARVNRAASYPLLLRLRHRWDLLGAVVTSTLAVSVSMAVLYTVLALAQRKVSLPAGLVVQIGLRWLCLFLLAIGLGLLASKLVSRRGSYLWVLSGLALLFTVDEWRGLLAQAGLIWPVSLVDGILWPVRTLLLTDPFAVDLLLAPAAGFTLLYALLLHLLAALLFRRKDLIWVE